MCSAPDPTRHRPAGGALLEATAVHDDAMLSRVVAVLGPHPVGAFSYVSQPGAGSTARITVEVGGDACQMHRVRAKLERIVGVLEVSQDFTDTTDTTDTTETGDLDSDVAH